MLDKVYNNFKDAAGRPEFTKDSSLINTNTADLRERFNQLNKEIKSTLAKHKSYTNCPCVESYKNGVDNSYNGLCNKINPLVEVDFRLTEILEELKSRKFNQQ